MRIGKDLLILTKKDGLLSALLMSQTFLDKECTKEVFLFLKIVVEHFIIKFLHYF